MDRRIRRGLGVIGLANSACGLFGVVGPVDYSMSAGLIAATGCDARRTFLPAALGLLACAASPTLVAALAAIPGPVMGAVLLYSLVSQLSGGLGLLVRERAVAGYADGVIMGLPLMAGLMVAFCPPHAFAGLPALWRPIAANGFVMGTLAGLLLEHVVFRNRAVQAGEPK
jgi:xanthine/uracil permease